MKKGVTLKDIAVKLHMSVSTVSKALSDDFSISDATKQRVKKLAEEWSYIPNEAARHFKQNKTFTIGLIIPNMLDQFYVLAINGVEKVAAMENYNVIISQSYEDPAVEEKIVDLMKRNRVDGIVAVITKKTENMDSFQALADIGIPIVFFARPPTESFFDYVTADNEDGAFKATDFLVKRGHRRVAHLMGPEAMSISRLRLQGYKAALQKNKISFDKELVKVVDLTKESTFIAMKKFMKMEHFPTAIFTFKNYITLDAIEYLKKNFVTRLEKIDFAGFGNLPLLEYLDHKPVASIEENSHRIGLEAAQILFGNIHNHEQHEHDRAFQHIKIPCRLIIH